MASGAEPDIKDNGIQRHDDLSKLTRCAAAIAGGVNDGGHNAPHALDRLEEPSQVLSTNNNI